MYQLLLYRVAMVYVYWLRCLSGSTMGLWVQTLHSLPPCFLYNFMTPVLFSSWGRGFQSKEDSRVKSNQEWRGLCLKSEDELKEQWSPEWKKRSQQRGARSPEWRGLKSVEKSLMKRTQEWIGLKIEME
jgi:hypothetical protein